ncbi:unnamed protein product [Leptosia nina]|uniref:Nucleic-acid-binding protein from transposon X-element n=1 Tax=Leptosia nina TaxID=320188 RepID=A0AAV1JZF8_9NEOP
MNRDDPPSVSRSRSNSGRAGSRRDPARAVDPKFAVPRPPAPEMGAGEALYDSGLQRTVSDPGLCRPRINVPAPPETPTVGAPSAARQQQRPPHSRPTETPSLSLQSTMEDHLQALRAGSPDTMDAMLRSLTGDVPPAPRGSPRAVLYSDAVTYAIVRKQVAFSDGLHAAVRDYLDRVAAKLKCEGLLSTPLTEEEAALAESAMARSTPLRRPRSASPDDPDRDSKRHCVPPPSSSQPLPQRDPRLRRRLTLTTGNTSATTTTAADVAEPAARPTPAARTAPTPSAALVSSAAPASSAEPATSNDAPLSYAQLAAAPAADRRPASPRPQPAATTTAAAAAPRYPPLVVEVLPDWTTHFRALRDRLGHAPNARPFGRGVRFSPKDGEEYRIVQRYLTELEKNQKVSWFSYSLPAERDLKVAIRGLPADTDPQLIMQELKSLGFEPEHAQRIQASQGRPGCLFLVILKKTPGLTPAIFNQEELLCMPGVTVEAWRGKRGPAQCHRCQAFRHSSHHCHRPQACVRCGGEHRAADCPRPRDEPATCANCKGAHPANHSSCPVRRAEARNKKAGTVASTAAMKQRQPPKTAPEAEPPTRRGPRGGKKRKQGGKGQSDTAPRPPTAQLRPISAADMSTRAQRSTPHPALRADDRPIALTHAALASIVEAAVQSALAATQTAGEKIAPMAAQTSRDAPTRDRRN